MRRCLLLCVVFALSVGLLLITMLPAPAWCRCLLGGAWIASTARDYRSLRDGAARVRHLALDALDNLTCIRPDGEREPVELLAGSVLLSRFAWLRLRFLDGGHYVELLRGNAARDLDWQRLQLIWVLRRTVVGAQDGS